MSTICGVILLFVLWWAVKCSTIKIKEDWNERRVRIEMKAKEKMMKAELKEALTKTSAV
jgi:hypothetical protein